MSSLSRTIDAQVDELTALGFERVTARLEDINPPCIWVALDELDHYNVGGDARLALLIIPGSADEYRALVDGGDTLDQLLEAGVSPSDVTRTAQVRSTKTTTPLAALRVTVTRSLED